MNGSNAEIPAQAIRGAALSIRRETRWVAVLCFLAALRVFFFSAAFPFFSNIDEQAHFDLVCKYARGHVPEGLEHWDADAARLIVLYDTPEYFEKSDQYPGGTYPPPRRLVTAGDRSSFERTVGSLVASENHESTQPPLYYLAAGVWYRIGTGLGLRGGHALYWIRFLNVIVAGLLTWLAYVVARLVFPNRTFPRLGVPLLITFFPQDVMYVVNNDVLLALVGGAAFFCLLLLCQGGPRGYVFHAGTGLLVAAALLVKLSSFALVPVCAAMVAWQAFRPDTAGTRSRALARGAVLMVAAFLPVGAWCARNYVLMGDVTGSAAKIQFLGWTIKPLSGILGHPIFTLQGLTVFWRETLATFWRGELVWALRPIASVSWDRFFGATSLVFVLVAVIAPNTWTKDTCSGERWALWPSLALFLLSLAFLATISVAYDFGGCFYPSRAAPYMSSGRLASGALIPFALLYLSGLDALLPRRLAPPLRWAVLIVMVALITVSEFTMSSMAVKSAYNWFHMN